VLTLRDQVADAFERLEKQIDRTSQMFDKLIQMQGEPLRLDYPSGRQFMCLYRQRDREDTTIGAYWRIFQIVKRGQEARIIWKKGWHPKRIPPSIVRKMDDSNLSWFREQNEVAKAIYSAREELVKKKQRIYSTLQSIPKNDDARMEIAERLLEEFLL